MLLDIAISASSIIPVIFECLNAESNLVKVLALYDLRSVITFAANELVVSVVLLESNLKEIFKISLVVCGSTITGVIDATVKGARFATSVDFSVAVKLLPVVDLIDIKTFPYSGVLIAPRLVSYEPVSPPKIETA